MSSQHCLLCCAHSRPTLWDPMDYSPPGSSLSMGFRRQEYWSGLSFPSPGNLPDPGIELKSSAWQAIFFFFFFFTTEWPGKPKKKTITLLISVLCINYKGIFSNAHVPCRLSFLISFLQFPCFVLFSPLLCFLSSLFPLSWISFLLLSFFLSLTWCCGKNKDD